MSSGWLNAGGPPGTAAAAGRGPAPITASIAHRVSESRVRGRSERIMSASLGAGPPGAALRVEQVALAEERSRSGAFGALRSEPRHQPDGVASIDGLKIAGAESVGGQALHVVGGRAVRIVRPEDDLRGRDELRERSQRHR